MFTLLCTFSAVSILSSKDSFCPVVDLSYFQLLRTCSYDAVSRRETPCQMLFYSPPMYHPKSCLPYSAVAYDISLSIYSWSFVLFHLLLHPFCSSVSKPYSRCPYIFLTSTPVCNFHITGRQVIGLTWSLPFNINTVRPSIGHPMWYQINFRVNTHSVDLQQRLQNFKILPSFGVEVGFHPIEYESGSKNILKEI